MKKLVIFDLDGTLVDTMESLTFATNKALESVSLRKITKEECRKIVGSGARMQIKRAINLVGGDEERDFENCYRVYRKEFSFLCTYKIRAYDGINKMLGDLKSEGYLLAVNTNKPDDEAKKVINYLFSEDTFDYVLGQKKGIKRKPSIDGPMKIISELGVEKENVIYVGDSDVDLMTGRNLGVKTVMCSWGFRSKEFLKEKGGKNIIDIPEDFRHYSDIRNRGRKQHE